MLDNGSSETVRSLADLGVAVARSRRVLTLFSGGLDSSWLLQHLAGLGPPVTALVVDLGEPLDLPALREVTARFGAELVVVDRTDLFAHEAVLPSIRAQARYHGLYPISASLSRPVIAAAAVELAAERGCELVLHSANPSQNSLRRLNGAIAALGHRGFHGSPFEFDVVPRADKVTDLAGAGLARFRDRGVSGDANLWCREFEAGALDDPTTVAVPDELWTWTRPPASGAPAVASEALSVQFEHGLPVRLDGERLSPVELIGRLNRRAGAHGVGRFEGFEHLADGTRALEVREAPAAAVLLDAYRHLEMATLGAELLRHKLGLEQVWVAEALEGRWFGEVRRAADAFIEQCSRQVGGDVRLRLERGQVRLAGLRAERPRYLLDRDAWERDTRAERAGLGLAARLSGARQGAPS